MLIKFNSVRLLGFHHHFVKPGINDIEESVVQDMMADPILAAKFESGELEVLDKSDVGAKNVKASVAGKEPSGVDLLAASEPKKAVSLVGQTVDMDVLEAWFKKDKRKVVRDALRKQIAKIKDIKYREKKDDADDEDQE